jgi:fructose-1,6-bisphosphatase I
MQNFERLLEECDFSSDLKTLVRECTQAAINFYGSYCSIENLHATQNIHGENQKALDLIADEIFTDALLKTKLCACISSEEREEAIISDGQYSVCFDPLDGSSIIEANFATGSIFGVYNAQTPIGLTPSQQVSSFYYIYGPNLVFVVSNGKKTFTAKYSENDFEFYQNAPLENQGVLAPANLQAWFANGIQDRLGAFLAQGLNMRYSGGLVADVHMLISKSGGLFVRPRLSNVKPKLRLVYECGPLAYIIESLGGMSSNMQASILQQKITNLPQTTDFMVGSKDFVETWNSYENR